MRVVKIIDVMASSDKSWEEAAQNALAQVSKTVRNIEWIDIHEFKAKVEDSTISEYKIAARIAFNVD